MQAKAYLTAFHYRQSEPVKERPIEIPDDKIRPHADLVDLAELAFHYGQNDFQPVQGCYSVSVGDVLEVQGALFRVAPVGFVRLADNEDPTALVGMAAARAVRGI
jgi:hypothetical protein